MSLVYPDFPPSALGRLVSGPADADGNAAETCLDDGRCRALREACIARMDPVLNRDISRWESVLARLGGLVESGAVQVLGPRLEAAKVQGATALDEPEPAEAVALGRATGAGAGSVGRATGPEHGAGVSGHQSMETVAGLARELAPWRKGPFVLAGCLVDTEWRSDLKWDRLKDHLGSLEGRRVLDVGCGSGYHLWRMVLQGARLAVGLEPYHLSVMQFRFGAMLGGSDQAMVLPFTLEDWHGLAGGFRLLPFDTVFSMGVLYHRRDHLAHLRQLGDLLVPGGDLVLETLVLKDENLKVLNPPGRYAAMSNVHAIPGLGVLSAWLGEAGYGDVEVLHQGPTRPVEQRPTPWMEFNSLVHSLDSRRPDLTIEGHPAPYRAVIRAKKR